MDRNKVIERLFDRKRGKTDNYKIGLVIEGGGMRSVFAGGAMIGLAKLGLSDCFDIIYASSSGSCAAAYFLADQTIEGTEIYYNELDGKKFINPFRFKKIMDLDYLFNQVMKEIVPLDLEKVKRSKSLLKIFVSEAETGRPMCFTNHSADVDLLKAIKASCSLPGFYNQGVDIEGYKTMDGNVAKKMPIEEAITDGCTDVLVVTTVPESYREPRIRLLGLVREILMRSLHRNFKNAYKLRREKYNNALDVIFGVQKVHRDINIFTISPDYRLSEAETKKDRLKEAAKDGLNKVREAFKGYEKVSN